MYKLGLIKIQFSKDSGEPVSPDDVHFLCNCAIREIVYPVFIYVVRRILAK